MVQTGVSTARALQAMYQPGVTYKDKCIFGMAYKNGVEEAEEEKEREEMEKLPH